MAVNECVKTVYAYFCQTFWFVLVQIDLIWGYHFLVGNWSIFGLTWFKMAGKDIVAVLYPLHRNCIINYNLVYTFCLVVEQWEYYTPWRSTEDTAMPKSAHWHCLKRCFPLDLHHFSLLKSAMWRLQDFLPIWDLKLWALMFGLHINQARKRN